MRCFTYLEQMTVATLSSLSLHHPVRCPSAMPATLACVLCPGCPKQPTAKPSMLCQVCRGSLHQPACRTLCCTVVVSHKACHSSSTTSFQLSQYVDLVLACTLQPSFNAVNKHWNTYAGHASAVQAVRKLLQHVTQDAGAIASSIRDGLASPCYPAANTNLRGLLSVLHWVLHAQPHLLGTLCIWRIMTAVLLGKTVTALVLL